jgi:hypothetical protein
MVGKVDIKFYGLVFCCPFLNENKSCPFREIRGNEKKERIQLLKSLTETQKISLYRLHLMCFNKRNYRLYAENISIG